MGKPGRTLIAAILWVSVFFAYPAFSAKDITAEGFPVKSYKGAGKPPPSIEDKVREKKKTELLQEMGQNGKAKNPDMWFSEGMKFYSGDGVDTDYDQAFDYWHTAAESNYPDAQHGLGILYHKGRGTQKNVPLAIDFFKKAAAQGHKDSFYQIGTIYFNGDEGVAQDSKKAFEYFSGGAKAGDLNCMFALGMMHYQGAGTEKDYAAAMKMWQTAAEKGHAEAQYNLGTMYEGGTGTAKNLETAKYWYEKAANKKHAGAMGALKDIGKPAQ